MKIFHSALLFLMSFGAVSVVHATKFTIVNLANGSDSLSVNFTFSNYSSPQIKVPLYESSDFNYEKPSRLYTMNLDYILGFKYAEDFYSVDMKSLGIQMTKQKEVLIKVFNNGACKIQMDNGKVIDVTGKRAIRTK